MEIREFAEQVLLEPALQSKLLTPGRLTDTSPGRPLTVALKPCRPSSLMLLKPGGERAKFPRVSALHIDQRRGETLHFFANHELLALELMALALLRFPNAPTGFRRRLVATMRDEQKHLKLYLGRMNELGVELGSIPLNSYFWDVLSTMETPMDFVAGMSLTFEQANLDFALQYRDAFAQIGDHRSASIMQEVLVDEMAHVRHGVHFFDRWRPPGTSQWDGYTQALKYPLTPARARGGVFNAEDRRRAGLHDGFIERLRVYSHSKGRPPIVTLFNPGSEAVHGQSAKSYSPSKSILAMTRDLEHLPMFLVNAQDAVLVRKRPSPETLRGLQVLGYSIPEFIEADLDDSQLGNECLSNRRLSRIEPWAWDRQVAHFLEPLVRGRAELASTLTRGPSIAAKVGSKAWLVPRLTGLFQALPQSWQDMCISGSLCRIAGNTEELDAALQEIKGAGYPTAVVKAPFGTAGGAALRIDVEGATAAQAQWMARTLRQQKCLVVEPWYERYLDFSYLFELGPDGLKERGVSRFLTDRNGRYRGALLGPLTQELTPELKSFFFRTTGQNDWVLKTARFVTERLAADLMSAGFEGRAGIDCMVVRRIDGRLALRLPLELNARSTMGHIALALAKPLKNRAVGAWTLVGKRDLTLAGFANFESLLAALDRQLTTIRKNGQLVQGHFCTRGPGQTESVLSLCIVGRSYHVLSDALELVGLRHLRSVGLSQAEA